MDSGIDSLQLTRRECGVERMVLGINCLDCQETKSMVILEWEIEH